MTGLCKHFDFPNLEGQGECRNIYASVVAAALFFTGWWVIIDVAAYEYDKSDFKQTYYLCGVAGTVALIIINMISNSQLRGETMNEGCCMGPQCAILWLFLGFGIGFGALIGSTWILLATYIIPQHENLWPGIALVIQNLFIFISAMIYKFGRKEEFDVMGM